MTDKRHGMVNYLAKCFCNDRLALAAVNQVL